MLVALVVLPVVLVDQGKQLALELELAVGRICIYSI
jgi:hypothetical protein